MNQYRQAGEKLAAMAYGCDSGDVAMAQGLESGLKDHTHPEYGNFQRVLCKYAAEAFKEAGELASFEYQLFKNAAEMDEWYPELDRFSDAVLGALGKVYVKAQNQEAHLGREAIKEAALNYVWPGVAGGVVRNTPALLKQIATLGIGAGAGVGSLMWLMNRHTRQDEDDIEAMKAKINYYSNLTKEIKNELGGGPVTEDQLQEAAQNVI